MLRNRDENWAKCEPWLGSIEIASVLGSWVLDKSLETPQFTLANGGDDFRTQLNFLSATVVAATPPLRSSKVYRSGPAPPRVDKERSYRLMKTDPTDHRRSQISDRLMLPKSVAPVRVRKAASR